MKNKVIGKGNIDIIFTLTNVFHLPVINRNLVSGLLLKKKIGIKSVFESDKLVLIRNGYFVCKHYFSDVMVKLLKMILIILRNLLLK